MSTWRTSWKRAWSWLREEKSPPDSRRPLRPEPTLSDDDAQRFVARMRDALGTPDLPSRRDDDATPASRRNRSRF